MILASLTLVAAVLPRSIAGTLAGPATLTLLPVTYILATGEILAAPAQRGERR